METTIGLARAIEILLLFCVARREFPIEVLHHPALSLPPEVFREAGVAVSVGSRIIYLQSAVVLPPKGRGKIRLYYSSPAASDCLSQKIYLAPQGNLLLSSRPYSSPEGPRLG